MKRTKINALRTVETAPETVCICGWVRTKRDSKSFSFMEINDGSCLKNMQAIVDEKLINYDQVLAITTGTSVRIEGKLVASPGKGQKWEIQAEKVDIFNTAPENYPLQKKRHTDEFLRTIAHLRPRTNKYGAIFRIRSQMAQSIHQFYNEKGFQYLTTPLITGSDCEGAGEMFRVTTIDPEKVAKAGKVDVSEDFFGQEAGLTVSGQLSAEMFALALGDVYTFGPTFRAENSNTSRHVAEFWMLEPEMAFCDLSQDMDEAEALVRYLTLQAMERCSEDLNLFSSFVDKSLPQRLKTIIEKPFARIPYTEAIQILETSGKTFEFDVDYGIDLQSEHERFIAEEYVKGPVFITDYPSTIKPFYMRVNDDEKTVAAMDLLVPGIGELIGGSQREDRLDILKARMDEMDLDKSAYWWYLDSRRFGSVPHAGFGMGFERFLMLISGIRNIRDVIPFPRTVGNIEF